MSHYVTLKSYKLSFVFRNAIEATDWMSVSEPRQVDEFILLFIEEVSAMSEHLGFTTKIYLLNRESSGAKQ